MTSDGIVHMNLAGMTSAHRQLLRDYCIRALDKLQVGDDEWPKVRRTVDLIDEIEGETSDDHS